MATLGQYNRPEGVKAALEAKVYNLGDYDNS